MFNVWILHLIHPGMVVGDQAVTYTFAPGLWPGAKRIPKNEHGWEEHPAMFIFWIVLLMA
jgi:hypothetical protein